MPPLNLIAVFPSSIPKISSVFKLTISVVVAPVVKAIDIKEASCKFFAFEINESACSADKILGCFFPTDSYLGRLFKIRSNYSFSLSLLQKS